MKAEEIDEALKDGDGLSLRLESGIDAAMVDNLTGIIRELVTLRPMSEAPRDGTEIEVLSYTPPSKPAAATWQILSYRPGRDHIPGAWLGGGLDGLLGEPVRIGWRPIAPVVMSR